MELQFFNIGSKVVCIGMAEDYNDKLTIGNVYTIADVRVYRTDGTVWISVAENERVNEYEISYFLSPDQITPFLKALYAI